MASLGALTAFLNLQADGFIRPTEQATAALRAFDEETKMVAASVAKLSKAEDIAAKTIHQYATAQDRAAKEAARMEKAAEKAAAAQERAAQRAAAAQEKAAARVIAAREREAAAHERHMSRLESQAAKAAMAMDVSFMKTIVQLNILARILSSVGQTFGQVFSAVEDAARTQTAAKYFDAAGRSLERLRQAAGGMVSDAGLIKKSNLADSMGLSESVFENLIRVAQAASAKTGQSFDHMFDSIVLGTARSSRLLLDNLGIIVSVKEANRKYAEEAIRNGEAQGHSISQVVKAMTAEAKQQAFLNELNRATAGQLDELKKLGMGGAGVFDKFAAAVDNLKLALSSTLIPYLSAALEKMTGLLNTATRYFKVSSGLNSNYAVAGEQNGESGYSVGGRFYAGDKMQAFSAMEGRQKQIGLQLRMGSGGDINSGNLLNSDATGVSGAAMDLAEGLNNSKTNFTALLVEFDELQKVTSSFTKAVVRLQPEVETKFDFSSTSGKGKGAKDTFLDFEGDLTRAIQEADEDELARIAEIRKMKDEAIEKQRDKEAERMKAYLAYEQMLLDMKKDERKAEGQAHDDRMARLKEENKEWKRFDSTAGKVISVGGQAVKGDASGVISAISSAIGAAANAPGIGEAIGQILGPMLGVLQPVVALFQHLQVGLALLAEGLVPLLATLNPLGPALQILLAAVGGLLRSALEPLIPALQGIIMIISMVVIAISALVIILSPIVEILVDFGTGLAMVNMLISSMTGMNLTSVSTVAEAMNEFTKIILGGAIGINNAIVDVFRTMGKVLRDQLGIKNTMTSFGKKLKLEDFLPEEIEATDLNTEATTENTKAVRDLAREFRNMPQAYKVNRPIYESTAPIASLDRGGMLHARNSGIRMTARDNWRWQV